MFYTLVNISHMSTQQVWQPCEVLEKNFNSNILNLNQSANQKVEKQILDSQAIPFLLLSIYALGTFHIFFPFSCYFILITSFSVPIVFFVCYCTNHRKKFINFYELTFDLGQEMSFYREQNLSRRFINCTFYLLLTKKIFFLEVFFFLNIHNI